MITVTQLAGFEPTGWRSESTWARNRAASATDAQHELEAQAAALEKNWPDFVGGLAAASVRSLAASQGELATDYRDGASVIDDAADNVGGLRDQIRQLQATVAADPRVSGPDEQGFVQSTVPLSLPRLIECLKALTYARQLTLSAREVLMQADGRDREASIALLALLGVDLPPSNDGPIDLTDHGILLQADLNGQDRYGDCTTLSTLIALAHSDPGFFRQHLQWDPSTGTYQVTLYDHGTPVTVSVDPDTLPTDGSQQAATNKPSFLSIYEQAIQQHFGDVTNGQFENVPISRITGHDVPLGPPPSPDDIRAGMNQHPPAVITADTANAPQQPDDVDPSIRVVPGHTYAVRGLDSSGDIVLQNPWGPNGGWHDGTYYPGEVHLTPDEYRRWFSNGAVLNPPY